MVKRVLKYLVLILFTTQLCSATTVSVGSTENKDPGSIDVFSGDLSISNAKSYIGGTFKVIIPTGITSSGKYRYKINSSSYQNDNALILTTFNLNDTLIITIPTVTSTSDTIKFSFQININPSIEKGSKDFIVTDYKSSGISGTNNFNILDAGESSSSSSSSSIISSSSSSSSSSLSSSTSSSSSQSSVTITNSASQTLNIKTGWQLLGAKVTISDTSILNKHRVFAYQNGTWVSNVDKTSTTLSSIDSGEGFWVNATNPETIKVTGAQNGAKTVDIVSGWQLKAAHSKICNSYLFDKNSVKSVFNFSSNSWKYYDPSGTPHNYQKSETINEGEGFWIYGNNSASLTPKLTVSGKVVDGYVKDARLEIASLDTGDSISITSNTTDADGSYNIVIDNPTSNAYVIQSSTGIDQSTGESYEGIMKAIVSTNGCSGASSKTSSQNITPITTLVSDAVSAEQTKNRSRKVRASTVDLIKSSEAKIATSLGINKTRINDDPQALLKSSTSVLVKSDAQKMIKASLVLQKTAEIMAGVISDKRDVNAYNKAASSIVKAVTSSITKTGGSFTNIISKTDTIIKEAVLEITGTQAIEPVKEIVQDSPVVSSQNSVSCALYSSYTCWTYTIPSSYSKEYLCPTGTLVNSCKTADLIGTCDISYGSTTTIGSKIYWYGPILTASATKTACTGTWSTRTTAKTIRATKSTTQEKLDAAKDVIQSSIDIVLQIDETKIANDTTIDTQKQIEATQKAVEIITRKIEEKAQELAKATSRYDTKIKGIEDLIKASAIQGGIEGTNKLIGSKIFELADKKQTIDASTLADSMFAADLVTASVSSFENIFGKTFDTKTVKVVAKSYAEITAKVVDTGNISESEIISTINANVDAINPENATTIKQAVSAASAQIVTSVKTQITKTRDLITQAIVDANGNAVGVLNWIMPSSSACKAGGGRVLNDGVCAPGSLNNAKKICSSSGAKVPTLDDLKEVLTVTCKGRINSSQNSFTKTCYTNLGFSGYNSYMSSTEDYSLGFSYGVPAKENPSWTYLACVK